MPAALPSLPEMMEGATCSMSFFLTRGGFQHHAAAAFRRIEAIQLSPAQTSHRRVSQLRPPKNEQAIASDPADPSSY